MQVDIFPSRGKCINDDSVSGKTRSDRDEKEERGGDKGGTSPGAVAATPQGAEKRANHEFVVVGTDGLFDVFGPQRVVGIVRNLLLTRKFAVDKVAQRLVNMAVTHARCVDNVTATIIVFYDTSDSAPAPAPAAVETQA